MSCGNDVTAQAAASVLRSLRSHSVSPIICFGDVDANASKGFIFYLGSQETRTHLANGNF